jgi:hypothetical protein
MMPGIIRGLIERLGGRPFSTKKPEANDMWFLMDRVRRCSFQQFRTGRILLISKGVR